MQNAIAKNYIGGIEKEKLFLPFMLSSLALLMAVLMMGKIILILVLFLAFIIFLATRPEIGVYLTAFFLPLTYLIFHYKGIEINFIDLIAGLTFLAFILSKLYKRVFRGEKIKIEFPALAPFLIFFGLAILSSYLSANPLKSLSYSVRVILNFYLLYLVLSVNVINTKTRLKKAVLAFIISALALSFISSWSFLKNYSESELSRVRVLNFSDQSALTGYVSRNYADFALLEPYLTEQNLLVETLLPAIFILLAIKYFYSDERKKRLINLVIIFVSAVLIGAFSRGAWISLTLTFIIYFLFISRADFKKKVAASLPILIIIFYPLAVQMYKLQTNYNIGVSSTKSRVMSARIGLDIYKNNPVIGVGPGEYINELGKNEQYREKFGDPVDALGILQKLSTELGTLGLASFFIFVLALIKPILKALNSFRRENYEKFFLAAVLALGWFAIFIFEFFNTSYYAGKLWFPLALVLIAIKLISDKYEYGEQKN